ncbi:RTA1-like protein [Punctularia strigosozonata HHB-11173 SS5]|uniref:RTA1-like protein n=1 Tax=Punctularia strigosozonata (strain HHB-11173) TaxID=741275 RepID=UPI00044182FA|nr:RTA1-like protein [Punctularia strigosozonata HHB-11173 SS5]EIN12984.1 RTA1-like protein [Punctularia strigosozonata HHB-11173 SS5]
MPVIPSFVFSRATESNENNAYGYIPTLWICALFVSLYGLSTLIHTGQAIYYRLWWLFPTAVLAGLGEILGWSARLWSSKNVDAANPFLIQISTTIISPTPLVAANFIILGKVIALLGPQYSRLTPRWYTTVFLTCDIVALVVQAYGGGTATGTHPVLGGNIMLGGIVFQLVAITIYTLLAAEFLLRVLRDRPIRAAPPVPVVLEKLPSDSSVRGFLPTVQQPKLYGKLRLMVIGLCISTVVIYIRSIYRTIELSDGWNGRVIHTQVYFNVLDGAMITIAMFTLNFFHPGRLLSGGHTAILSPPETPKYN